MIDVQSREITGMWTDVDQLRAGKRRKVYRAKSERCLGERREGEGGQWREHADNLPRHGHGGYWDRSSDTGCLTTSPGHSDPPTRDEDLLL